MEILEGNERSGTAFSWLGLLFAGQRKFRAGTVQNVYLLSLAYHPQNEKRIKSFFMYTSSRIQARTSLNYLNLETFETTQSSV